eukprot:scpid12658/ scgid4490/ Metabotropic glutamate receptor 5
MWCRHNGSPGTCHPSIPVAFNRVYICAGRTWKPSAILLACSILVVLFTKQAEGKFTPARRPNVLLGDVLTVDSKQADLQLTIFLPMHKHVSPSSRNKCDGVDVHEAVPMAESVALAFEMVNCHPPLDKSFEYQLIDTCAWVPVALHYLDEKWYVTDKHTSRYYESEKNCSCRESERAEPGAFKENNEMASCTPIHKTSETGNPDGPEREQPGQGGHRPFYIPPQDASELENGDVSLADNSGSGDTSTNPTVSVQQNDTSKQKPKCAKERVVKRGHWLRPLTPAVVIGPVTHTVAQATISSLILKEPQTLLHITPTPRYHSDEPQSNYSFSITPIYELQVRTLLDVCSKQNWTHIAVLVSKDEHNQKLKSILDTSAEYYNICIAKVGYIDHQQKNISNLIVDFVHFFQQLKRMTSLTTVVVLADEDATVHIWNVLLTTDLVANETEHVNSYLHNIQAWQWVGFQDWKYVAENIAPDYDWLGSGSGIPVAVKVEPKILAPLPSTHPSWECIEETLWENLNNLKLSKLQLKQDPWLAAVWENMFDCRLTCLSPGECQFGRNVKVLSPTMNSNASSRRPCDTTHRALAKKFLVQRSLQIMGTIFTVVNVTNQLLQEAHDRCTAEEYKTQPHICKAFWGFYNDTDSYYARYTLESTFLTAEQIREKLSQMYNEQLSDPSSCMQVKVLARSSNANESGNATSWRMETLDLKSGLSKDNDDGSGDNDVVSIGTISSTCPGQCSAGNRRLHHDGYRQCCFDCKPCPVDTVSDGNTDQCQLCPKGHYTNREQSHCIPYPLEYPRFHHISPILIFMFSMVGVLAAVVTLVLFRSKRTHLVVKAADITLTTAQLVTLMISFAFVNILLLKPSNTACTLKVLVFIWPVVNVVSLAIKTNRLRLVFQRTSHLSKRKIKFLSNKAQVFLLVLLAITTAAYFILWVVASPPHAEIIYTHTTRRLVCKFNDAWMGSYFSWTSALIIVTLVLAFSTRQLPGFFNEAPFYFLASALILACWIFFVPAYYFSQQVNQIILLAAIILSQCHIIFGSLFIRRLYYLWRPLSEADSKFLGKTKR